MSPLAALLFGVGVTAIALVESWQPWPLAPFPIAHAALAIVIPALCGALPTARPLPELRRLMPRQLLPFAAGLAFVVAFVGVYAIVLQTTRHVGDPSWDLVAAYRQLVAACVNRYGLVTTVVMAYLLLGLWPAVGEELFYRGVVLRGLLGGTGTLTAVLVSATLFGLRHAAQLVYFLPIYPVGSGIAYFVWAFGLGVLWGWVYARSGSLWVCIAVHCLNVVLAPFVIVLLLP